MLVRKHCQCWQENVVNVGKKMLSMFARKTLSMLARKHCQCWQENIVNVGKKTLSMLANFGRMVDSNAQEISLYENMLMKQKCDFFQLSKEKNFS